MLDTLLIYQTDHLYNRSVINYTDIKNNKINITDTENNLINKTVFEHLNCNKISLYSNMAQMTVFHFQRLFIKTDRVQTAADLMRNIDKIY